ncbi:MAG: Dna2/Cas4 domain-containing protein [Candidatus Aenigmarchaeota archaeon]|nr:Dna2/Cas4 domain-containing protein [Candidatus Aenigmarchaeota archaeon]
MAKTKKSLNNNVRLSPTALATYDHCPRKFFYVHIRKIPVKKTAAMIRGTITHKVLDHFFNYVSIADIQEDDWEKLWTKFKKVLNSLLATEWKQIGDEYPDCFKSKEKRTEYLKETKRFLDFYAAKLAFSVSGKLKKLDKNSRWFETELKRFFYPKDREFRLELEDDNMSGVIDKTLSLFGKGIAIVDYKTSKCSLPHYIPASHLKQGKAYAYLWKEKFNELPKHISFYYLRAGESVYYPITEDDIEEIKGDIKKIRSKKPIPEEFPKNKTKLCDYCDFSRFCWKKK